MYSSSMDSRFTIRSLLLAIAGTAVFGAMATAAEARPNWRGDQFDASREGNTVERQQQRVPLRDVVRSIKQRQGGQFLDASIVNRGGGECYVVKWVTDDGRRIDFLVDAQSGAILDQRGD
ncbi:MAG: PepSY domain-containing protein [Caulobacterales bacterium]